ncbi:hypothetical protein EK21DRAFT_63366 [Setomelanomma holmii]|uniref:Zn(2)-C6 fungal-type domain-containing protein n=1 Tax=Setomelanomma holmii TaxID=210430 RepID=A0A9P4LP59_9PLEO|nr:hypothetical protein EK21DRAFT_63366 [Setomelanomma holmii]
METSTRKLRRQRAILSCNECRRRKLKCDRLSPCDRCIKGGIAETCAYGPEAHISASGKRKHDPKKKRRLDDDRSRRATSKDEESSPRRGQDAVVDAGKPEAGAISHKQPEFVEPGAVVLRDLTSDDGQEQRDQVEFLAKSPDLKSIESSTAVMGMLKGRSYGTHFYGPSSAMSVVAHFPDLRAFMKDVYRDSTARRLSKDVKASEERARSLQTSHRIMRVRKLRDLLPDRVTVDTILRRYFDTFETTFRIIHVPSFDKAYESYWTSPAPGDSDIDALILAMLACTICTSSHDSPRYNNAGSSFSSKAILWIRACEAWLRQQSNKHRSLASFQVRCLRLLALSTSSLKVKQYYQEVLTHVALLRSVGLHRDPSIFGTRCSVFEGEMRRRLWATSVEIELQAAIDKGTSSILSLDHDCALPRNIDDVDLHSDLETLPRSHHVNTFTDTSFLYCAMQTAELRASLCANVNSLKQTSEFQATLQCEDKVRRSLKDIPRWTDQRSSQARNLLDLQLRQFLVVLHAPRALQHELRGLSDCRYAMFTSIEAASKTIEVHNNMMEASNYALLLTRNDYLRAILLICHVAYHARRANDSIMLRLAKQVFDDCAEKSLRLQEERAARPGRGSEYYWYTSAAVSLVRKQFKPTQAELMQRQAIDRVAKLLYKVLSLQDDPTEETLATEIILGEPHNVTVPDDVALHTYTEPPTLDDFSNAGLRLDAFGDDLGDTPGWMDDLWFLNVPSLDLNDQSHSMF